MRFMIYYSNVPSVDSPYLLSNEVTYLGSHCNVKKKIPHLVLVKVVNNIF